MNTRMQTQWLRTEESAVFAKDKLRTVFSEAAGLSPTVYHAIKDLERLKEQAVHASAAFQGLLRDIADGSDGALFAGARIKTESSLKTKLDVGQKPEEIKDYLGGKIVAHTPAALQSVARRLFDAAQMTHADNQLENPYPSGYRALHVQILNAAGFTAEVQIVPYEINNVKPEADALYQRWRRRDIGPENRAAFEADSKKEHMLFRDAWAKWQARAGSGAETSLQSLFFLPEGAVADRIIGPPHPQARAAGFKKACAAFR